MMNLLHDKCSKIAGHDAKINVKSNENVHEMNPNDKPNLDPEQTTKSRTSSSLTKSFRKISASPRNSSKFFRFNSTRPGKSLKNRSESAACGSYDHNPTIDIPDDNDGREVATRKLSECTRNKGGSVSKLPDISRSTSGTSRLLRAASPTEDSSDTTRLVSGSQSARGFKSSFRMRSDLKPSTSSTRQPTRPSSPQMWRWQRKHTTATSSSRPSQVVKADCFSQSRKKLTAEELAALDSGVYLGEPEVDTRFQLNPPLTEQPDSLQNSSRAQSFICVNGSKLYNDNTAAATSNSQVHSFDDVTAENFGQLNEGRWSKSLESAVPLNNSEKALDNETYYCRKCSKTGYIFSSAGSLLHPNSCSRDTDGATSQPVISGNPGNSVLNSPTGSHQPLPAISIDVADPDCDVKPSVSIEIVDSEDDYDNRLLICNSESYINIYDHTKSNAKPVDKSQVQEEGTQMSDQSVSNPDNCTHTRAEQRQNILVRQKPIDSTARVCGNCKKTSDEADKATGLQYASTGTGIMSGSSLPSNQTGANVMIRDCSSGGLSVEQRNDSREVPNSNSFLTLNNGMKAHSTTSCYTPEEKSSCSDTGLETSVGKLGTGLAVNRKISEPEKRARTSRSVSRKRVETPVVTPRRAGSSKKVSIFGNLAENSITRKIPFLSKKKSVVSQDAGDGVVGGPTGSGLSGNKDDYKKWAVSFDALLSSKQGVELFRLFLQREFSDENIEFWLACEEFKHLKGEKMTQKAKSIYTDFVAIQSHREVNLDSSTREQTIEAINTSPTSKHIFDNAQARIVALMDRDSYPRFLKSELYLNLAKS